VQSGASGYTGSIQPAGGWWTAFGTGGFEGEPPLLEGASLLVTVVRLSPCIFTSSPSRTRHQLFSHRSQVHDGFESFSSR
jgi:hypothetical protein